MVAGSDDPAASLRRWLEGSSLPDGAVRSHIRAALDEIARLREDCAEAYQVVGVPADIAGLFGHSTTIKALDNLDAAAAGTPRPHADVLPTQYDDRSTAGGTAPPESGA